MSKLQTCKFAMAILKFRIYFEEDDSIYRDVAVRHTQSFLQLHQVILKAYEFDSKHQATFYRSNDNWQRGREITLEKYDKPYRAEPLLMESTTIGSEIRDPNQKFVYVYDFVKNWGFLVELISVSKEENGKLDYPAVVKAEGIPPSQYGTKGLVGDKLTEMEEKYDLTKGTEGFVVKGEGGEEEVSEAEEEPTRKKSRRGRGGRARTKSFKGVREPTVIIIVGPTAVGKTAAAIRLAQQAANQDHLGRFPAMLSRIEYRRRQTLRRQSSPAVHHYFINSHSIHEEVNAAIFEELALQWTADIFRENPTAVMVGRHRALYQGLYRWPR